MPDERYLLCRQGAGERALPLPAFTFADALPSQPAEDPTVAVIDHDLAYILFTSGSTGTPKGVMLSHLNALTFVNWSVGTFGVTAEDRLSNHAPFNFDLSVFDIFVAVKAGAALSLVPEGLAVFPFSYLLSSRTKRSRSGIPSRWCSRSCKRAANSRNAIFDAALGALCRGGFSDQAPARADGKAAGPRYANLYGPTETNVCAWYEVEPLSPEQTAPIPIGKACANTDLIAINADGNE